MPALLLAFSLLAESCAPQAFTMNIDMRHPSESGLDLSNKSMAVVYLDGGNAADSSFNYSLSEGFARKLESDYFNGAQVIDLYRMPKSPSGDYTQKDTLLNLIMDSGDDVVFLFDAPVFGNVKVMSPSKVMTTPLSKDSAYVSSSSVPFETNLYVYDSMNKKDSVLTFNGKYVIRPMIYSDGTLSSVDLQNRVWKDIGTTAQLAGGKAASSFVSTWQSENYTIIYYDGLSSAWTDAAEFANDYKWDKAIAKWMTLVSVKNSTQRSCAEYNIALGCYMLGQYALANQWLDSSDKDCPISLSSSLRRKIIERTK